MKTTIYLIGILGIAIFMSCRSVETLVDKGDYDAAIDLATRKMSGDKIKKTKHIKGLEKAFLKVNSNDLEEIDFLRKIDDLDAHERILDISEKIAYRQKLINPYLPLISKDGYRGRFDFIDAKGLMVSTSKRIASLSFDRGIQYLDLAKATSEKKYARDAYYAFARTIDFDENHNDVLAKREEAKGLGVNHVLIETLFDSDLFLPYHVADYLNQVSYQPRSSRWIEYYNDRNTLDFFDYIARLKIDEVEISPEREKKRVFFEEKEIEDGKEYVLDENGNVAKDTLGNDIKQPKYSIVRARIKEIVREKFLGIRANMEIVETRDNRTISHPIAAEAIFEDFACIVKGDRRALSSNTKKSVKDYPLEFPTDAELLFQTSDEIKLAFRNKLDKIIKKLSA